MYTFPVLYGNQELPPYFLGQEGPGSSSGVVWGLPNIYLWLLPPKARLLPAVALLGAPRPGSWGQEQNWGERCPRARGRARSGAERLHPAPLVLLGCRPGAGSPAPTPKSHPPWVVRAPSPRAPDPALLLLQGRQPLAPPCQGPGAPERGCTRAPAASRKPWRSEPQPPKPHPRGLPPCSVPSRHVPGWR